MEKYYRESDVELMSAVLKSTPLPMFLLCRVFGINATDVIFSPYYQSTFNRHANHGAVRREPAFWYGYNDSGHVQTMIRSASYANLQHRNLLGNYHRMGSSNEYKIFNLISLSRKFQDNEDGYNRYYVNFMRGAKPTIVLQQAQNSKDCFYMETVDKAEVTPYPFTGYHTNDICYKHRIRLVDEGFANEDTYHFETYRSNTEYRKEPTQFSHGKLRLFAKENDYLTTMSKDPDKVLKYFFTKDESMTLRTHNFENMPIGYDTFPNGLSAQIVHELKRRGTMEDAMGELLANGFPGLTEECKIAILGTYTIMELSQQVLGVLAFEYLLSRDHQRTNLIDYMGLQEVFPGDLPRTKAHKPKDRKEELCWAFTEALYRTWDSMIEVQLRR